jgi:hypothetical protein
MQIAPLGLALDEPSSHSIAIINEEQKVEVAGNLDETS